ncbi:MAG: N-acetylmuramoyl-L-alanine amidase [Acutalibacteraceae bacterium]
MKITNGIVDIAIQRIIPIANTKARPRHTMTAEFITIHNTANAGATAKQNADYVVNQNEYKSWHFTVGNNEIYQHLPINESGWHSGDGEHGYGNRKSIGIEIAEVYGADRTAVKFVAELVKSTGIPIENIVPHKSWSGKNCPRLILPHWDSFIADIKAELGVEEVKSEVKYKKYNDRIHELRGEVKDLAVRVVDKRIWDITEYTNCVNGTFYMLQGNGKTHPTSILYQDGISYQDTADHYRDFGCPQSVFIFYKDGKVDMKRIKKLSELNLANIRLVIGGLGLRNTQDSKFYYSPVAEGFKAGYTLQGEYKNFSDVLRKANKTVLGYNKKLNKVYLLTVQSVSHGELINLISQGEEHYDIAISLDGGGSTFMDALGKYVFKGQATRQIHNIIGFNL